MKKSLLLSAFAALSAAFFMLGNSSGAGAVQGVDRTGSPLSPGSCNSSGCHDDGAFDPSVEAVLLDGTDTVDTYQPGQAYTLRFTINAGAGAPSAYGFQAVALTGDDDAQAGAWGTAPDGLQVTEINERDYLEHSEPQTSNTFDIPWTAPQTETGPVRFYVAGNAVNRDFSTNGDGGAILSAPLTVNPLSSSFRRVESLAVRLSAFPNPVGDQLQLDIAGAVTGIYQLSIHDLNGRLMAQRSLYLLPGSRRETLDFAALPAGPYLVRLTDGRRTASLKVLKD